jgi:hypothetical protein
MLQGVPAFIMRVLFAALLYPAPVRQRGLRFAPPSALRGTSVGATMTTPGGAGTTPRPGVLQG